MSKTRMVALAALAVASVFTARPRPTAASPLAAELAGAPALASDPLAVEIDRWSKRLAAETTADPLWTDVKQAAAPVLGLAEQALRDDRRLLALLRLAAARENLAAGAWMLERPSEVRGSLAAFEGEWARMGESLRPSLGPASPDALRGLRPALARALGEAALHQVRVYYDASVEYGRSTTPDSGLFYLGAAQAQAELVALLPSLGTGTSGGSSEAGPAPRSLVPELDALETEILSAYRPPFSVDQHPQFIAASSALKTARELDAAGLRYGALLRYLQAVVRFAPLRAAAQGRVQSPLGAPGPEALARARAEDLTRFSAGGDHSLGRVFLELADAELLANPNGGAATAAAIVNDVLPRYFAALQPAPPSPPRAEPLATVTLVRWPYT
jgi:hypothetical protein